MENEIKDTILEVSYMKEFSITLDSNPSTGYTWVPLFDEKFLELTNRSIKSNSKEPKRIGSSLKEAFKFKPIKCGITTLKMIYKRVWEEKEIKELDFKIKIQ
ncbi:MAG: protease inhibitor I42 family protein [Candidatus Hodarchaeota archaeon]